MSTLDSANHGFTLDPREVQMTTRSGVSVRRSIPDAQLRRVGAWCFVDHYGPTDQVQAMSVAAHPHAGLQTASWLFSGGIDHRDSIGSVQEIAPGQLNLMTAGRGISHSELSRNGGGELHGVQMWIALPETARHVSPSFEHHKDLPRVHGDGWSAIVIVGSAWGQTSPATVHTPLLAAQVDIDYASVTLPIRPDFEHAFLVVAGSVMLDGHLVAVGQLRFVPLGATEMEISTSGHATVMVLGGEPFDEKILMWWNFIARTHDEIALLQEQWNDQSPLFPRFQDDIGGRIPAPALPKVRLTAR